MSGGAAWRAWLFSGRTLLSAAPRGTPASSPPRASERHSGCRRPLPCPCPVASHGCENPRRARSRWYRRRIRDTPIQEDGDARVQAPRGGDLLRGPRLRLSPAALRAGRAAITARLLAPQPEQPGGAAAL